MIEESKVKVRLDIEMTKSLSEFIEKRVSEPIGKFCAELDGERVTIYKIKPILKKGV